MTKVALVLILIIILLLYICFLLWKKVKEISFGKKSLSTRYGKMTEQFLPFLTNYPYDPQNFRFLGTPIDGIQFEGDKIIFVEFKTASSRLTEKQKQIKELVEKLKIEFKEMRI